MIFWLQTKKCYVNIRTNHKTRDWKINEWSSIDSIVNATLSVFGFIGEYLCLAIIADNTGYSVFGNPDGNNDP